MNQKSRFFTRKEYTSSIVEHLFKIAQQIVGLDKQIQAVRSIVLLCVFFALSSGSIPRLPASLQAPPNIALINGQWFTGKGFEARTGYSVNGRFTFKKPKRIDQTLDLAGSWLVPPFGEAHNHNINGNEQRDRQAIQRYISDGVFYVKLPGNFYVSDELKAKLGLNTPGSIDVRMAQGASLTATGGHPWALAEDVWFRFGYAKGPIDSLNGKRFFTIDTEEDLEKKWPDILKQRPDFLKTTLWVSGEYELRKNNKAYRGHSGLNPKFLSKIVAKAHAANLKVSTHVNDANDFHVAVAAGVDEIAHLPLTGLTPIALEDATLAARRGIVVVTTCTNILALPPTVLPQENRAKVIGAMVTNIKLLRENGVTLVLGSDMANDTSVKEFEYLQTLGLFDNLALLKMWAETTPRAIFPERKIGMLQEGYEASFLALEANPLEDLQNVRKINLRCKQGVVLGE